MIDPCIPRLSLMEKLGNGMSVIALEMDYSPVTAVSIAYGAGSLWETPETRGYSHLCEHMMFKGSRRFPSGQYWRMVQRNGGFANAYTSRDITLYYCAVPKAGLCDILRLEADRMGNCLMTEEDVASESAVILEEELMTIRDDPGGSLDSLLYSEAFRHHPYGRPITGTPEEIRTFSSGTLIEFYRNYYNPENAVISIVGDIDAGRVYGDIEKLFGGMDGRRVKRPTVAPEPPQNGYREVEMDHPSHLPRLSLGFRVPEGNHPDSAALSLISVYLSSGRSSRFEKLLVKPSLVLDVSVSTNTNLMPGLFTARALVPSGGSTEDVGERILEELHRISEQGIDETDLERIRNRRRAWSILSSSDPLGMSRRLATGFIKYGDPCYYWKSIEELNSVSCGDTGRMAETYLKKSNATAAVLRPSRTMSSSPVRSIPQDSESRPDLVPPAAQPPAEIRIPHRLLEVPKRSAADNVMDVTIDNGLRVVLKEDSSFPTVSIGFSCPMGSDHEPVGVRGLAEITAETMLYGTLREDSIAFNARLENLGTSMEFSAAHELSGGVISCLEKNVEEVLRAIFDMLTQPGFRKEDFLAVRADALAGLEEWLKTPLGMAMSMFSRQSTDPPERASVPTRESLAAADVDRLRWFHETFCGPKGSVIVAVGNFTSGEMLETIERIFSGWRSKIEVRPDTNPPGNSPVSSDRSIRMDGREQIALIMGYPAPPRNHDDTYAISLLSHILGEGIGSRLGRNIREAGLSYSVNCMYIPLGNRGRLAAALLTSPGNFRKACDRLKTEFMDIVSRPVSGSELRLEKASYIGSQELGMMKYSSIARILLSCAATGLPLNHDLTTMHMVSELTEEELRAAAEKWLGQGITWISTAGGLEGVP